MSIFSGNYPLSINIHRRRRCEVVLPSQDKTGSDVHGAAMLDVSDVTTFHYFDSQVMWIYIALCAAVMGEYDWHIF